MSSRRSRRGRSLLLDALMVAFSILGCLALGTGIGFAVAFPW